MNKVRERNTLKHKPVPLPAVILLVQVKCRNTWAGSTEDLTHGQREGASGISEQVRSSAALNMCWLYHAEHCSEYLQSLTSLEHITSLGSELFPNYPLRVNENESICF